MMFMCIVPSAFAAGNYVYTKNGSTVVNDNTQYVYYDEDTPITYGFLLDNPDYSIRFTIPNSNSMIYFSLGVPNESLTVRSGNVLDHTSITYLCNNYPQLKDTPIKFNGVVGMTVKGEGRLSDPYGPYLDLASGTFDVISNVAVNLFDFVISNPLVLLIFVVSFVGSGIGIYKVLVGA